MKINSGLSDRHDDPGDPDGPNGREIWNVFAHEIWVWQLRDHGNCFKRNQIVRITV